VWLNDRGVVEARASRSTAGAVLDAVVHMSGEATALFASSAGFALVRYDESGAERSTTTIVDDAIATDPPALRPGESTLPIEPYTHDVGRIVADGEGVFLATRTGRHSVVAYGFAYESRKSTYFSWWRTLVVPAHPMAPVGLTGGTYDTFAQLEAQYAVHVALGSQATRYVGVQHARVESGAMLRAHEAVFGEKLRTDPDALDVFVTRLANDGSRLGTAVVSTPNDDELYRLRAIGDSAYALGRTEHWNEQGTGFDALVARVDPDGRVIVRELDVDRSDVAFDVAPAREGGVVVVGASGWSQNPRGASISEGADAFAIWLRADGGATRLPLPSAPRHNEARFVLPHVGRRLLIGGMRDGPGTHSADSDLSQLFARAFVHVGRELEQD
jgi:hypothetical protein